jgi:hypothetical protein
MVKGEVTVVVAEEEVKKCKFFGVHIVNTVMLVIVISQLATITVANSTLGVKRKLMVQDLEGQIIHDDGSSNHGRCNIDDFVKGSLKSYTNVVVNGVTGSQTNPVIGVVDEGAERLRNVILLEHQNYGIDSPWQLMEVQGYREDKSVDQYMKRYYKTVDNKVIEKLYFREPHWTHFIRVNAMSTIHHQVEKVVKKMTIIHENYGHPPATVMIQMCDKYDAGLLGFTKSEVLLWQKHTQCKACLEGTTTNRRKDVLGRLIYTQYGDFGDMDGLHFDVFHINRDWAFLLVKSHKTKMNWVFHVGINYTTEIIKESIETVFGDYRYTGNDVHFVRSDADPKFFGLRGWIQRKGLRYYMAPRGIKTSRGERGIRTEKNMIRTLLHNVKYTVPRRWIPYAVMDASNQLNIRYNHDLGMSPREKFFGETFNYQNQCFIHFGQIISYPDVTTSSDVDRSRLNHGAVVGRDLTTGNLFVENFQTKVVEKVAVYVEIIEVDENIKLYFRNYDKVSGFKYNKDHVFAILNNLNILETVTNRPVPAKTDENPGFPTGPLHCNRMEVNLEYLLNGDNSIKIQSSFERFANLHDDEEEFNVNTVLMDGGDNLVARDYQNRNVIDTGSQCHGYRKDHEVSAKTDIAFMIMNVMKEMNPLAQEEDIITMSNTVVNQLNDTTEVTGSILQELFIDSISDPHHNLNIITNLVQMSYKKMHKKRPDLTKVAGTAEMQTVSDRKIIQGVHRSEIPDQSKVLYIMTKYAEKFKLGEFDKVKARLLLGGNELWDDYQLRWDEISSRTIALASLYTLIAIMAHEQMDVLTMDFKNAFLYGLLPTADQCYARIPKEESVLLMEIDEEKWRPYYNKEQQCIFVKVVGSLYGHPAAAKIWYDYLKMQLAKIGFIPLKCEPCIFFRTVEGTIEFIGMHVDDLLMGSHNGPRLRQDMEDFKRTYFNNEGTITDGPSLEYLNMLLEFNKAHQSVEVSQESYWKSVCAKFEIMESDVEVATTVPHSCNIMSRLRSRNDALEPNQTVDEELKKKFLSVVMSILWGTQRSKQELGVNISHLASEAKHASEEDYKDVMRVLKYISQCKGDKIRFKIIGKVQVACYIDSSAHTGPTCLGQAGCVISIGSEGYGGPIEAKSARSKNNHVGSMPYELDALHHMISGPLYIRELLEELGYKQGPVIVFEDNKALIDLIRRGKVSTGVTRHIAAKYYYAKDLIAEGLIVLRHCPTKLMIADILTKHLGGPEFKIMSRRLQNTIQQDSTLTDEVYRRLYLNSSENVYNDEDTKVIAILSMVIGYLYQSQPLI